MKSEIPFSGMGAKNTAKTQPPSPCWDGIFFFLSQQEEGGCVFAVFFAPIPEKEISDFIAHGSIIQVLTVLIKI